MRELELWSSYGTLSNVLPAW